MENRILFSHLHTGGAIYITHIAVWLHFYHGHWGGKQYYAWMRLLGAQGRRIKGEVKKKKKHPLGFIAFAALGS